MLHGYLPLQQYSIIHIICRHDSDDDDCYVWVQDIISSQLFDNNWHEPVTLLTALHLATTFRQYSVMIRLIINGANIEAQTGIISCYLT